MVCIEGIAIDTGELHCKRRFDVDHRTIRQSAMLECLGEVFQRFVTPLFVSVLVCFHIIIVIIALTYSHIHLRHALVITLSPSICVNLFLLFSLRISLEYRTH